MPNPPEPPAFTEPPAPNEPCRPLEEAIRAFLGRPDAALAAAAADLERRAADPATPPAEAACLRLELAVVEELLRHRRAATAPDQ
jgi:hypothetical protein